MRVTGDWGEAQALAFMAASIIPLHPEQGWSMLDRLLTRYRINRSSQLARMLAAKADHEVAIRIAPTRLSSWDFSTRMVDAVAA